MRFKVALFLSAFFYVLGYSLTPDEMGQKAASMNLRQLYEAKDSILYYEELSDSSLTKWLPVERIVESRIDSLVKFPSQAKAAAEEETGLEINNAKADKTIIRDFGFYVGVGYASGGDYLNIITANSGLSSISGISGFLKVDIGAQFKAGNHFYLCPRIIVENSTINTNIDDSVAGVVVKTGTSETYNALILPGVDARYYLQENSRYAVYVGGSVGVNAFLRGFNDLQAKADVPQLGIFAGTQVKLFHWLFGWRENGVTGLELGYNYIPLTVSNLSPASENVGGVYISISRYFLATNYR
jgi:hypothetical protein